MSIFKDSRRWAEALKVNPHTVYLLAHRKKFASLPFAIELEKVSQGRIKVEQVVRPEVAQALKEYLKLRCPTLKVSNGEGQLKSDKEKEEVTVE